MKITIVVVSTHHLRTKPTNSRELV